MTTKRRPAKAKATATKQPLFVVAEAFGEICDEINRLGIAARESAAFHALESIEAENQDSCEQRQQAIRMAGVATGYLESLKVIRARMENAVEIVRSNMVTA